MMLYMFSSIPVGLNYFDFLFFLSLSFVITVYDSDEL